MVKLQLSGSVPESFFELNGLDYPKGDWEIYYSNVDRDEQGVVDEEKLKIDIRSKSNKSYVIQAPIKASSYVNSSDEAYTKSGLLTDLADLLGFQEGSGGGEEVLRQLGWAFIGDSQYTEASPLVIASGTTVTVDLDGIGSINTFLPEGVTSLYDVATSKITPAKLGDGYTFTLGFKGSSTSNNGSATLGINIGGTFEGIFKRSFIFPRGIGVSHDFYFTSQGYSIETFLANGGLIEVTSDTGSSSIYDISLQIHRTSTPI